MTGRSIIPKATIALLVLMALLAPVLASMDGLLNYGQQDIDKLSLRWQPPGHIGQQGKHYLGTTKLGKDVAAGLVYGARAALVISGIAVGVALFLGLVLGMAAGYFGDDGWRLSWWQLLLTLVLLAAATGYLLIYLQYGHWLNGIAAVLLALAALGTGWLPTKSATVTLPLDSIVLKVIEVRRSIPLIYLLVVLGAVIPRHTYWTIGLLIGVTCWTGIARHSRVLVMELRAEAQHDALIALSVPTWRILGRHFLIQIWPQIKVLTVFLASTAILLETSLSFLGLGLPSDMMTWGSLLSECRERPSAWWLAVFPGLLLTITLSCLNSLGRQQRHELSARPLKDLV